MREIVVVFDLERKFILYTAIVILAVGVGPFATYEAMTFWQRVMFWSLDVYGGMAIVTIFVTAATSSNLLGSIPMYLRIFLGAFVGAIPAAGFVTFLFGAISTTMEIQTTYPLLVLEMCVFSTILLMTEFVVWPAIFGHPEDVDFKEAAGLVSTEIQNSEIHEAQKPVASAFFERLPLSHRNSELISISMQDHYAEVTTTTGVASLLMRLSDAEALLQSYPGCRVHRSHWVASDHAKSLSKLGRTNRLHLSDGRALPVSEKYLKDAKQMLH